MSACPYPGREAKTKMNIKVENLEGIQRTIRSKVDQLKPVFKKALEVEKERIQSRTQSGLDVDGNTFDYYRPFTVKNRRKNKKQVNHVDLTFSGDMFRAFKARFSETEWTITGVLSFGDESWKVLKNEGYGRNFFGLSNEQVEIIKNKLRNAK
jgi:hypothetical protein